MRRDDVLQALAAHRDEFAAMGVSELAIFGSVARDEAVDGSDVDVLVDFDAVIKNLAVIGEAARRVPASVVEAHPEVPWSKMRAMRNVVVHEYSGIDEDVLWGTVTEDLRPLVRLLAPLLVQSEEEG